jgi:hypothetical protein
VRQDRHRMQFPLSGWTDGQFSPPRPPRRAQGKCATDARSTAADMDQVPRLPLSPLCCCASRLTSGEWPN